MKLIHDSELVIGLVPDTTLIETAKTVFQGSREECQAEAARLNLLDPRGYFRAVSAAPASPVRSPANPATHTLAARDFIDRFSATEYAAAKASDDANIQKLLAMIETGEPVNLLDARTIGGMRYAASIGLIAPDRVSAILA